MVFSGCGRLWERGRREAACEGTGGEFADKGDSVKSAGNESVALSPRTWLRKFGEGCSRGQGGRRRDCESQSSGGGETSERGVAVENTIRAAIFDKTGKSPRIGLRKA